MIKKLILLLFICATVILTGCEIEGITKSQTSNTEIVEDVKPQSKKVKEYSGEPISLNFRDMSIRVIFKVFVDHTDRNIIASDSIVGNLTINVTNKPWDEALDVVLETKSLEKIKNDNLIYIFAKNEKDTLFNALSTKKYTGELLSMDFQEMKISVILQILGEHAEKDIIIDNSVASNTMTIRLIDVPWDQALDVIVLSNDLKIQEMGDVIVIKPNVK